MTGYKVHWNAGGEEEVFQEIFSCDETVLTFQRDSLSPYAGLPFKFKVSAQNYQGYSELSDSVRILTAEVPSAPPQPIKVAAGKLFITVRWTASTYTGGVPIESYKVYVRPQGGSFVLKATLTDFTDFAYTETVAEANTGDIYSFQVSATNEVGESQRSVLLSVVAGTVPNKALNLVKHSADINQITFNWDLPTDDGGSPITDYQVYWDAGLDAGLDLLTTTVGGPVLQWSTSGTVSAQDLADGVIYKFALVTQNAVGLSSISDEVAIYAASIPDAPYSPTLVSQSAD